MRKSNFPVLSNSTIDEEVKDLLAGDLVGKVVENQSNQAAASHATDFDPPIYNIWKQQEKTPGSTLLGKIAMFGGLDLNGSPEAVQSRPRRMQ